METILNKRLGDICEEINYGFTASATWDNIGPKFLRITDIQDVLINWEGLPNCKISNKDFEKYRLNLGDIVIARTGNSTGSNAIIKKNFDAVFASYLIRYKIDKNLADPTYVSQVLKSKLWQDYVYAIKGGSAQPGANAQQFAQFVLPCPSLPEQYRIAEILSAFDDKIELNLQMNKTLEEMAMAIYKEWFVDFGPFRDGNFVDSELGPIPEEWEVNYLPSISICFDRLRQPVSSRERLKIQGEYPYYGATGILDYVDEYRFDGRYILLAEDGTVKTNLDKPYIQFVDGKFWVSNHAHVLKGVGYFSDEFLKISLSNINVTPFITGAVQLKVNQGNMNLMRFITGSESVHNKFDGIVKPIYDKIFANRKEIYPLTEIRDYLLPKLISGEVRVNEVQEQITELN